MQESGCSSLGARVWLLWVQESCCAGCKSLVALGIRVWLLWVQESGWSGYKSLVALGTSLAVLGTRVYLLWVQDNLVAICARECLCKSMLVLGASLVVLGAIEPGCSGCKSLVDLGAR